MCMRKIHTGDLVGRRFVEGGRDVQTGVDCWGLVMEVYRRFGMDIPDFTVDSFAFRQIHDLVEYSTCTGNWDEVQTPTDEDAPLVVLMRIHPALITHAGVWLGHGKMIHTMKGTGVVVSHVDKFRSRIAGYYRYV